MQFSTPKLSGRHSGSPVPCRSPSPDVMTRSSIVNTRNLTNPHNPQQLYSQSQCQSTNQFKFLREENKRLLEIISSTEIKNQQSLNNIIKDKDRVIQQLKTELDKTQNKSHKSNSMKASSQKSDQSDKSNHLLQTIKNLKQRIGQLEIENQNLKWKKNVSSGETPKHKPVKMDDPVPFVIKTAESQIKLSYLQNIKEQLNSQLNKTLLEFSRRFTLKLEDLERRLTSIDNDLGKKSSPLNKINNGSTIGSFPQDLSPGVVSSSFGQSTNQNNFYTPKINEFQGNHFRLTHLQEKLSESRTIQNGMRRRIEELQFDLQNKNSEIRILHDQINRLKPVQPYVHNILSDSQSKNKLIEENSTLKQNLTRMSGEIVVLKNDRINAAKQFDALKRQLQNEKKSKTIYSSYQSVPPQPTNSLGSTVNKQLESDVQSLRDTLAEVRRSLRQHQETIQTQRRNVETLRLQNSDLSRQVKSLVDSKATMNNQILRLKQSQQSKILKNNEEQLTQSNNTKKQIQMLEETNKQLRLLIQNLQFSIINDKTEVNRLQLQNTNLKRMVNDNENQNKQFLLSSGHLKQQIRRFTQEKIILQEETNRIRNQLRKIQTQYSMIQQKKFALESQKRALIVQNQRANQQLNQSVHSLKMQKAETERLLNENGIFQSKISELEYEIKKIKNDNQTQNLINELSAANDRLRDAELQAFNLRSLQMLRNNQLQSALAELAEVKRLLNEMNFESVEAIIKQLQYKDKIHYQQKIEIEQRYARENERFRKDTAEWSAKYCEQKDKADRMTSVINHLEADNKSLSEKIERLQTIIKEYISHDGISTTHDSYKGVKSIQSHVFDFGDSKLKQMEDLKEPVQEAMLRLDKITEKIEKNLKNKTKDSTQNLIVTPDAFIGPNCRRY